MFHSPYVIESTMKAWSDDLDRELEHDRLAKLAEEGSGKRAPFYKLAIEWLLRQHKAACPGREDQPAGLSAKHASLASN